ncbi:High-affnity carbon uptake protein Hat/HatR [uncultured Candidatus Thioglobus sp.]|nr:High-affnity carbon uptake protein Hat/HatR [uncultured Candidatus Thioglobus sp.]
MVKSFGGVGKTTLCRQLAYNLYDKDDFPNVIWLDASQGLNSKLVNILSSRFGREDIEDPVVTFVGIVNNTMGKGVIIIDNLLEDSGEWSIASGLQGIKFPCIINSRYRDIDFDDVIELDFLSEPDCLSLYCYYSNEEVTDKATLDAKINALTRAEKQAVTHIVDYCGNHTLVLELVAKIALLSDYSPAKMWYELENSDFDSLIEIKAGRGFAAEESEKLIQHIGKLIPLMKLSKEEALLLQSLSCLPVFAFETDVLKDWLNLDNAVILNSLVKKSLLNKSILTNQRKNYLLHDILARAVRQVYGIQLNGQKSQQFIQKIIGKFEDYGSLKVSKKLVLEALLLHRQKNFDDKKGYFSASLGLLYLYTAQYSKALPYLETSLAISQEIGDKAGEGVTLNNIATIYQAQGDYTTALTYFTDSLAISQKIGNKAGEGATLNNIAMIYRAQGNYTTALTYFTDSLAISQKIGNKAEERTTLNNIASIYQAQGDYTTALTHFTNSLAIRQEIGNKAGEGATLNNIATIYQAQGDYTTALTHLTNSLAISQEIGNKAGEGTTLNNIATIYQAQGDYTTALTHFTNSLAISQEIGDKAVEGNALFNIGLAYYKTGKKQQGLVYLQSAKKIAQEIDDFELNQALDDLSFDV